MLLVSVLILALALVLSSSVLVPPLSLTPTKKS